MPGPHRSQPRWRDSAAPQGPTFSAPLTPVNLVVFSGSTRRPSKSRALAEAMALRLAERRPINLRHFDLIDAGVGLSAWSRGGLDRPAREGLEAVEEAEALIVTAPTYCGSYPGLFKHLFDLVDTPKLEGKPVLIGATGGGHRHALVVEHQIRPLFAFFSAAVAPRRSTPRSTNSPTASPPTRRSWPGSISPSGSSPPSCRRRKRSSACARWGRAGDSRPGAVLADLSRDTPAAPACPWAGAIDAPG
jgi:FMN reductase